MIYGHQQAIGFMGASAAALVGGGGVTATANFSFNDTLAAVVDGLAATDLSLVGATAGYEGPGGGDKVYSIANINATSPAEALANGEYLETTITGSGLTISSIAYKAAKGGSSGPRGFALRTDEDNYATELFADVITVVDPTYENFSHNLSIAVGSGRTLRLYPYSTGSLGASVKINDLIITASG